MTRGRKAPLQIGLSDRHIAEIATTAGNMGIYTVESMKGGIYYFLEDDKAVVATSKGFIKADINTMEMMAEEILGILADFRTDKREGRRPMDTRAISKMLEVR